MDPALIQQNLSAPEAFTVHCFDTLASTNQTAAELARKGVPEWSVVLAEQQSAGRGRYQRTWHSPPGMGIWMSLILRPRLETSYLNLVNLLAAYTLAGYLEQQARAFAGAMLRIDLKWPNDLIAGEKKLCGILLESSFSGPRPEFVVLGMGINVNQQAADFPPELRPKATSLAMLSGTSWQREALVAGFLDIFRENAQRYLCDQPEQVARLYREKVRYRHQEVIIQNGAVTSRGTFEDITPEGYMVLRENGRRKIITTGEIFDRVGAENNSIGNNLT